MINFFAGTLHLLEKMATFVPKPITIKAPTPNAAATKHKKLNKRVPFVKYDRNTVWLRMYGNVYNAKCYCCEKSDITPLTCEMAHVQSLAEGGTNHLDNIWLTCHSCNSIMGTMNAMAFKKMYHHNESCFAPMYIAQRKITEFYNLVKSKVL